jgi:UDP-N-acetylmuramoyl-tripeptide--D-alanyl-D-alanine ligase
VIDLAPERIAAEIRGSVVREGSRERPERAVVDSREAGPGDLFFALRGEHADGADFAPGALTKGAWGAVVSSDRAQDVAEASEAGWIVAVDEPLAALQCLARGWRRELGCRVVGITGSTGKTSVKDIARAILPFRVHASPENFNTEIGLPLAILAAGPETEVLVLEMAMRGLGQITELCEIAEPDVAAITNVGPVHLELLGTLEAIAAAKAEILTGLRADGRAVLPADAEALQPHISDTLSTLTFGPGGDVHATSSHSDGRKLEAQIHTPGGSERFQFPFAEAHNLTNALCAVAIGEALGASLAAMAVRAPGITFSRLRGETLELAGGILLLNDCYNANPVSMRAALEHLATMPGARRLAVLGEMRELGPDAIAYHREVGAEARRLGIGPLIGVGEMAREYAPDEWVADAKAATEIVDGLLDSGDVLLVKGSRAVGLEVVADTLGARPRSGDNA